MIEQAVLDRIVEQQAVLLVGENEVERVVPVSVLPRDCKPGCWLRLESDKDGKLTIQIDTEATEQAARRIAEKVNRLKQRGRALTQDGQ
jgi:hypothetical protein